MRRTPSTASRAASRRSPASFPPTDLPELREGRDATSSRPSRRKGRLQGPLRLHRARPEDRAARSIHDPERRKTSSEISPAAHVSADDPPTLIIHGDADKLVLQQAQALERKLRDVGVPVKVVVKPGAGHGWPGLEKDIALMADWFDAHLGKVKAKTQD